MSYDLQGGAYPDFATA